MESVGRCKLCGVPNLDDINLQLIDDFIKQAFDVILLKLTFDDTTQQVICEICFSKLSEAFDFKSTCLDTEDIIFRYVNSEKSEAIDLKEIYAMEKIHKQESKTLKNWVICRLCFQPVSSKFRDIQDVPFEIMQIYIPEINFGVTTNASICTKCFESLYVHSTFIKSCSTIDDKTNIFAEDIHLTNSCIKTEEVKIESEETFDEEAFCEILPNNVVKKEEIEEGNTSIQSLDGVRSMEDAVRNVQSSVANYVKYEISSENRETDLSQVKTQHWVECKFETEYKNYLEQQTFKCDKCEYVAKRKSRLASHQLIHKDPSEVEMLKCDECDFETKWKRSLVSHKKVFHRDPSELRMYKCDKCQYESKCRRNFLRHQLIHRDRFTLHMHKCDKCAFESKYRSALKLHYLVHRDAAKVKTLKCDKCEYVTRRQYCLANHQLIHKDPSELRMHKCDKCQYESKYRSVLKRHYLVHMDAAKMKTLECDKCEYVTKRKDYLGTHKRIMHKNPSELQTYKCDKCQYESRFKYKLTQHQLIHKDAAEVKMFKCDTCEYVTKRKATLLTHRDMHPFLGDIIGFRRVVQR